MWSAVPALHKHTIGGRVQGPVSSLVARQHTALYSHSVSQSLCHGGACQEEDKVGEKEENAGDMEKREKKEKAGEV